MATGDSDTGRLILKAAKESLLSVGFARLSTRSIAEQAGVPLSQIHYHFGSKQNLVLAVLAEENRRLLDRQESMFHSELPLWRQWDEACDYLEDDLDSGYVRVLHEMISAGWSDAEIAEVVLAQLGGWTELLTAVARRAQSQLGSIDPFTPEEVGALVSTAFIGSEAFLLLGMPDQVAPVRTALRKVGSVIRRMETGDAS